MKQPHFQKLAIYGVGLLGGSIALAARQRQLVDQIIGIGRSAETLMRAQEAGAIDSFSTDPAEGVADADLVILCTPVRHIIESLPVVMAHVKSGALITDVGSTKASIIEAAEKCAPSPGIFVGSHPMAGSELSGMSNAKADLFENANCFITPTPRMPREAVAKIAAWWQALGCRLAIARPERHDMLVALVSHLPHMVAVALVRAVESFNEDQNLVRGIIGNGFRDTTRIACGSAQMWQDICSENRDEIERACSTFEKAFQQLLAVHASDPEQLKTEFLSACDYRKKLDER
ncbi:MAG: prephenate dehydrogenase [Candidatus Sumerlaeaceae bacterium]